MDTQQALQTLQALQGTIQGNATAYQGQSDAITIALGIINGTLQTQVIDLENQYKKQIINLTEQVTTANTERDTAVSQFSDLQSQVNSLTDKLQTIQKQLSAITSQITNP